MAVSVHIMMVYREVEVKLHTFLAVAPDCSEWLASWSKPLYAQGKSPSKQLSRKPGGPQNGHRHFGKEINNLPLQVTKPQFLSLVPTSHHTN
jgi:hypothetical protein